MIAKKTPVNQHVERSLVPIALAPEGLDPVKPQVVHPRLALPNLIQCQTSLNSLIYGANFWNYLHFTHKEDLFSDFPSFGSASEANSVAFKMK